MCIMVRTPMTFAGSEQVGYIDELFQELAIQFAVSYNAGLTVRESTISDDATTCRGIFVTKSKLSPNHGDGDMVELLRIPRESTFSIHTILEILEDKSNYQSEKGYLNTTSTVKKLFQTFCQDDLLQSRASETLLLVIYFVLFDCLKRSGYELPSVIDLYLQKVLLQTEVGSLYSGLPLENECLVKQYFGQYGITGIFEVFEGLVSLAQGAFWLSEIPDRIGPIFASIVSRCLEIPQELSLDCEDFIINSTLVPILDFANHDNGKTNAHFDIDRGTCDVLLLLDTKKCPVDSDEFEVFISYTPVEELFHFGKVYGFYPEVEGKHERVQFWNMCIDQNYFKVEKPWGVDLGLFYKWFSIKPCVQFILYDGRVLINDTLEEFGEILLPFVPNPLHGEESCFQYNVQAYKSFARFAAKANGQPEEEYVQHFREYVDGRERSKEQSIAVPQLAWTCYFMSESYTFARLDKSQCIDVVFEADESYDYTRNLFTDYIRNYCFWRIRALNLLKVNEYTTSVQRIAQLELHILNTIVNQLNNGEPAFWTDLEGSDLIDLPECPLPPLLQISGEHLTHIKRPDFHFEESEFTNFFDEELERYLDFFKGVLYQD